MPVYSKDGGQTLFEVPEDIDTATGESNADKIATSKGYTKYIDVTKDGKQIYSIPSTDLNKAIQKGYQLPEVSQAKQEYTKALQPNAFESGISGAADVMSMGFGDELSGAASAANTALHGGNLNEIGSAYTKNRDISRAIEKNAAEQHPMAHLAGQGAGLVAGIAAGGLASGGEAAAEATPTILGKIGQGAAQGAKLGAGLGAVGGAGESEATLGSKEFFGDVAKGTGEGALTGGALGGAGSALSEGAQAGSKALKKSFFSATKAEKGQNFGNEALNELGEKATPKLQKDADILTEDGTFSKVNDSKGMYKDSFQKQQQYGQQISDMLQGKENDATRYEYKNLQNLLNSKPSDSPERIIIQKNIDSLKNTVKNTPDLASINAEKSKYYNSLKTSDFSNPNISTTAEIEKAKAADLREGIINNFINSDVKASDANKFVDLNSRWGAHQNL